MPSSRSFLALANAAAGSAKDAQVAAALDVLRAGADVEVVIPEGPDGTREAVSRAAGRDVVVLGGDGSLHRCVHALVGLDLLAETGPIAVVPLGTGNDFARGLGLPLDPAEAARVALHGVPRSLDLLLADDGGVVVNVAHAGVGAGGAARAGTAKGLFGTSVYAMGAVRAGVAAAGWHLRVTVDGRVLHDGTERLLMVTVALGTSIGGGAPISPRSSPEDGLADVVLSTATGPIARAQFALALRRGHHLERDDVSATRGREITIEAVDERNVFRVNADGEVGVPLLTRSWRVEPGAWACMVPADAAA